MTLQAFWIAILPSLFVAVVMAIFNRRQATKDKETKAHEDLRIEGENLKLELLLAATKLSYATAMAMKRGKPNGEVEEGIAQYEKAMEKFQKYERHLVVQTTQE